MGKKAKQNSRKGANQVDSDGEDDYRSVAGSVDERSSTPVRNRTELSSRQLLSEAVEKLSEKRYTTRESGFEQLIKHFQTSHDSAAELSIDGYQDTILTQLLRSLRRPPSLKEGKLCTQLLPLVGLYLGQDEVEFFSSVEKPLKHLVHTARPELIEMRGNALMCLSFLAFICGGVDAGHRIWSYCEHILRDDGIESDSEDSNSDDESKSSSSSSSDDNDVNQKQNRDNIAARISLRCAAAKSWVLLATLRTHEEILAHCTCEGSSLLEPLLELLQYYDGANAGAIDTKITAGKCLAYLWEVASTVHPGAEAEECGRLLAYDHTLVEKILTTINEISKDSSKRISKKDRKEQRSEFRIIEEGVTKSETPNDTVRMQGAIVDIDSFQKLHIVDVLKEVLGSGFHSSLRLYSVVKDVLEIEYVTSNMDGGGEDLRIGKGSSAAKSRSVYRKQDRRMRQMETTLDGEDFCCYGGEDD